MDDGNSRIDVKTEKNGDKITRIAKPPKVKAGAAKPKNRDHCVNEGHNRTGFVCGIAV